MSEAPVILFDGVCNFCNYWVQFAIKHNSKQDLKFAALQSPAGAALRQQYDLHPTDISTVIFIENGKVYTQSSAALRICRHLNTGWKLFYGLNVIPEFIRDPLYNFIARNRYRWFGKKEQCMIPTAEQRARFLD